MLQQFSHFTEANLRLPKPLKEATSAQVNVRMMHNAADFVFLGQTQDILEQLGCIHSAQDLPASGNQPQVK